MTREELIHRVKAKIEELSPYGYEAPLIAIQEDSELTENINKEIKPIISYISECLNESCNTKLSILPLHLIKPKEIEIKTDEVKKVAKQGTLQTISVKLPLDFLRIHSIKFKDWSRVVSKAISAEHPDAVYEANLHTMGKPTRPVCMIDVIEGYKWLVSNSSTAVMVNIDLDMPYRNYVARFDDTNIQDTLADYFVLQTAIDVCKVLNLNMREQLEEELNILIKSNQY
jgi:hypothetical protein